MIKLQLVLVLLPCGCVNRHLYISNYSKDAKFPYSTDLLRRSEFQSLRYYELADDIRDPNQSDTIYETWGDKRFLANADMTLRYRHKIKTSPRDSKKEYCPVAVGIDIRFPLNASGKRAIIAFIRVFEDYWKIPLTEVSSALEQINDSKSTFINAFRFKSVIAEVTFNEIPQRGLFVSINLYDRSFYEQIFGLHKTLHLLRQG